MGSDGQQHLALREIHVDECSRHTTCTRATPSLLAEGGRGVIAGVGEPQCAPSADRL